MELSTATLADLPAIADLVNAAYRGEASLHGWTTEAHYMTGPRTDAETLRLDMRAQPDAVLLMLRDGAVDSLLGCVWLQPAGGQTWYLGMLTIRPDCQRARLGRALLAAAENEAAKRGACRMRMTVINVRDTLIAWYLRRGYALTAETLPFPYEDDRFGKPLREDLCFVVLERLL